MPRRARARPSPEVEVRPARRADLPALARFGASLARAHHAWDERRFFLPEEPVEEGYAWWLGKELANPRAVILVAVRGPGGGRAVGYAYGRIEPRDWNRLLDRCGMAVDLWLEPEARRAGAGRLLVERLVDELGRLGAPRVVLEVAAANRRAQRVFARLGFRRTMLEMTREVAEPGRRRAARQGAAVSPSSRAAPRRPSVRSSS
jgi:RimJ/RimL family protein N-acetyltransferase